MPGSPPSPCGRGRPAASAVGPGRGTSDDRGRTMSSSQEQRREAQQGEEFPDVRDGGYGGGGGLGGVEAEGIHDEGDGGAADGGDRVVDDQGERDDQGEAPALVVVEGGGDQAGGEADDDAGHQADE